jgi:anaerobic ribonucleoside-triphosphate reductase|tara:strand:+ start:3981 stop:4097 length:117 start_codon:yes stop_codon:yes gene_type:complete
MIRHCEHCWESYDTERNGNEFFCPKCAKLNGVEGNGMD